MPERRKRVALSLSPELHSVLKRIADVHSKTITSVVLDFLNEFHPYLDDLATSLEMAKDGKDPSAIMNRMMGGALTELGSVMSDVAATAKDIQVTK